MPQVNSNPEANVQWFFGDRLITNLTLSSSTSSSSSSSAESSAEADTSATEAPKAVNREHQVYYLRESGTMDKTSQLTLSWAREQDSGTYVCWAANKADRVAGNVTLLVRASAESGGLSRGVIAGLILGIFTFIITCMLICCFCSMKRARMHANLRNRRSSSAPPTTGQYDKSDLLLDPFIRRSNDDDKANGALTPAASLEPARLG